ncbi:hypothetical protein D0B32_14960 [Paraburkholderia sp. DHOC27]|nr:hypothetical protein D0B32_14960 [Paraburkholderia sp. DHOC27]
MREWAALLMMLACKDGAARGPGLAFGGQGTLRIRLFFHGSEWAALGLGPFQHGLDFAACAAHANLRREAAVRASMLTCVQ